MAEKKYIVKTFLNGVQVHKQQVDTAEDLEDNAYVIFDKNKPLTTTAGDVFAGGTEGEVTGQDHENARAALESYHYNVLGVATTDEEIQKAYVEYTKRQRQDYGVLFQLVTPYLGEDYNHEAIICHNDTVQSDDAVVRTTGMTYYNAGLLAACEVQNSTMNTPYKGGYTLVGNPSREDQRNAIDKGLFMHHRDGDNWVVFEDINTLTTISPEDIEKKNEDFKNNQTIRVLDGLAQDTANIFNKSYLGYAPNEAAHRTLLRDRIEENRLYYQSINAIRDYDPSTLVIEEGDNIRRVVGSENILVVNCMEQLFFTINLAN